MIAPTYMTDSTHNSTMIHADVLEDLSSNSSFDSPSRPTANKQSAFNFCAPSARPIANRQSAFSLGAPVTRPTANQQQVFFVSGGTRMRQ